MPTDELMLKTAQELSSERAGGHGDRWGVFVGGVDALFSNLQLVIKSAEWFDPGIVDKSSVQAVVAAGEPNGFVSLYTGQEKGTSATGVMSLHVPNQGDKTIELWSAYPFFGDGAEVHGVVDRLLLHPNHVEATLEIGLDAGPLINAFDPLFLYTRALYRAGETYRFSVSALAYSMRSSKGLQEVIDDPDSIRRSRAREAWAREHGEWTKEYEGAALAAWQPKTPEDLEPIRLNIGGGTIFLPTTNGFSDDALYVGEVAGVTKEAVKILETNFWRVDVTVIRDDDVSVLTLPVYVAETLFDAEWRPSVGEYVTGNAWIQACAKSRL